MLKSTLQNKTVFFKLLSAAAVMMCICACEGEGTTGQLQNNNLEIGIPEKIRRVSAVDLDAVTAIANVTVDNADSGQDFELTRVGDRFTTTITLQDVSSVAVNLRFSEQLPSGEIIDLARHSQVTRDVGDSNIVLQFFEGGFNDNFDADGDGITNLQERSLGTDPLTPSSVRRNRQLSVQFTLPAILPDPLVTQSIVTFAGVPRAVSRIGNLLTITGSVTTLEDVDIEIVLLQQVNNQRIVLANSVLTEPSGFDDVTLNLSDGDFDFSRDDDGDGRANVEEVRNGSDPLVRD